MAILAETTKTEVNYFKLNFIFLKLTLVIPMQLLANHLKNSHEIQFINFRVDILFLKIFFVRLDNISNFLTLFSPIYEIILYFIK